MKSSEKDWFSAKELEKLELPDLPKQATNITRKAMKENWKKRDTVGVKGGGYEYHISSLPIDAQKALGAENTLKLNKPNVPNRSDTDELELIPYYEVYASAGYGSFNMEVSEPDDYIGLSRRWLTQRGFRINHLTFIQAMGDSMYPTINDGDALLIDLSENTPKDGRIYVLRQGEQIFVKRVQGIINGIRLISDNKEFYQPVDIKFDEALDLEVIGRVVYIGHSLI